MAQWLKTSLRRLLPLVGCAWLGAACVGGTSNANAFRRLNEREAACNGRQPTPMSDEMAERLGNATIGCYEAMYRPESAKALVSCKMNAPCGHLCQLHMKPLPPLRAHHDMRMACERAAMRCRADPADCWDIMKDMSVHPEGVAWYTASCFDQPCRNGDPKCDPCKLRECVLEGALAAVRAYGKCSGRAL